MAGRVSIVVSARNTSVGLLRARDRRKFSHTLAVKLTSAVDGRMIERMKRSSTLDSPCAWRKGARNLRPRRC